MKRTFFFKIYEQFLTPEGLLDAEKSEESHTNGHSLYWADADTLAEGAYNLALFLSEVTDEMSQEEVDTLGEKYSVEELMNRVK